MSNQEQTSIQEKRSEKQSPVTVDLEKLPQDCWRPFEVLGGRKSDRITEREIDKVPAKIRSLKYPNWTPVRLWDYSPTGFGILFSYQKGYTFSAINGESIELCLEISQSEKVQATCMVTNLTVTEKGLRIGLCRKLNVLSNVESALADKSLIPHSEFPLVVKIANPIIYREWCYGHVEALGKGPEIIFSSDDPSLLVIPGMKFSLHLDLPTFDITPCIGIVSEVFVTANGNLYFKVNQLMMSRALCNSMGEYFLQTENWSPAALNACGFWVSELCELIKFGFVSSMEQYAEVLTLRRNAYVAVGKKNPFSEVEDSALELDAHSRILTVYHKKQLIASIVLNFPNSANSSLRSEGEFPEKKYPVPLPPREQMIEVFSLCTHRDYRQADLLTAFFINLSKIFLLSDRHWVITFVTDELMPLYEKIGFTKTGAAMPIASLNNQIHHLIILSREDLIIGKNMSLIAWCLTHGNVVQEMVIRNLIPLTFRQRCILHAKFWMKVVVERIYKAKLEQKFQEIINPNMEISYVTK